ncbi:MAG: NYN domain-containing protein [Planctomycetota bacterium]
MMPRPRSEPRLLNRPRCVVFLDFEGFLDEDGDIPPGFDAKGLFQSIRGRGDVAYACAYGDWSHYRDAGIEIARAGFDLVQVFDVEQRGDCASAIHLAVDALNYVAGDASVDTVYLISEGVDFSPLTRRLREKGVRVIGVGLRADEEGWLESSYDCYAAGGRLNDQRETSGLVIRRVVPEPRPVDGVLPHAEHFQKLKDVLANLRKDGHESVNGTTLMVELRRLDPQFDPAEIGCVDLAGFLQGYSRMVRFERRPNDLVVYTMMRETQRPMEECLGEIKTAADYAQLLSKLQLRVTPRALREPVIQRIFERVQEAADRGVSITAGEIEEDLLNEFHQAGGEDLKEALRNTLRVLFVNRAFRLDNVDDGYQSPLTFNRHYIRAVEDLQDYYVESILCAVKNMVRERGGTQVHLDLLAELLFDDAQSTNRLKDIDQNLRGAERPFKKPPKYGGRWTPATSPAPLGAMPQPITRQLVREEMEGAAEA